MKLTRTISLITFEFFKNPKSCLIDRTLHIDNYGILRIDVKTPSFNYSFKGSNGIDIFYQEQKYLKPISYMFIEESSIYGLYYNIKTHWNLVQNKMKVSK